MTTDPDAIRAVFAITVNGGLSIRVKVVPGASRTKVAGLLGDRLKIVVAAAAERGQANRAVGLLLAKLFGIEIRDIRITAGQTHAKKTIELIGIELSDAMKRLKRSLKT